MPLQFHMTPGSCSTGIHILLEELEMLFEVYIVNLLAGDQDKPAYRALNPKGTIPTLVREDGRALTDFQAIAWWLARQKPKKGLLPEDADGEARVLEIMDYAVGTLHGQGFARIFTTEKFAASAAEHEAVKARGREIVIQGFDIVEELLAGQDYAAGRFSIADAALFYVEFWASRSDIPLPPNCEAHYRRMLTRPAVRQVLAEEGYRV
ncbi:glutathione S-transferase [Azoarcus indigens]|uniref:Glutathione S-transferase n=1 Tax=Azoarcus indigens TaxID=29545 RepID=A0A4R6EDA4_9RHOO|nr:glutathione S-transferase family protein [Azoarcus indigens]NMG63628.1 glutathione S-transferase [Azoarcus indigens]TDN56163.1 glutathione S-transferase [Azoarcus indigens]